MRIPGRRDPDDEVQESQDRNFGKACAYWRDEALMRRLGLRLTGYKRKWTRIGTVHFNPGVSRADVEVSALPSLGWRFTVHHAFTERPRVISTGGWCFTEVWPFVEMLLAGHQPEAVFAAAGMVLGEGMFVDHTEEVTR
jgi:hypothetical protein